MQSAETRQSQNWMEVVMDKNPLSSSPSHETGRITVYTIVGCRHCKAAKALLKDKLAPFTEVNLDEHPGLRPVVAELSGRSTVPQIFFNAQHVGGNDELQVCILRPVMVTYRRSALFVWLQSEPFVLIFACFSRN